MIFMLRRGPDGLALWAVGDRQSLESRVRGWHMKGLDNTFPLRWRHNGHDGVSNHQPHDWLLNCSFRRRSRKTSNLRVTGLCVGNSQGTGEFPAQMTSNAENVPIWWRHHVPWYGIYYNKHHISCWFCRIVCCVTSSFFYFAAIPCIADNMHYDLCF